MATPKMGAAQKQMTNPISQDAYKQMVLTRVALFPKIFQIELQNLWVLPMGTQRYHTKNGPHSMHPRGAIGRPIFTSMAM